MNWKSQNEETEDHGSGEHDSRMHPHQEGTKVMTRLARGKFFHHSLGVLSLLFLGAGGAAAQDVEIKTGGVLRGQASRAPASPAAEVESDYRVGAGDVLDVLVWKEQEASATVPIRPDGKISLPLINDLEVTGKTPIEIQEIVVERLSPFIKDPNVTVTVRQINSKKVYLLGEVAGPGAYQIMRPTTVLQILTEAGGLRPFAKEKDIYVLRVSNGQQQKFRFNYKDVIRGKKMEQNILLEPGDTIVVP